jgi:hypothetical protein
MRNIKTALLVGALGASFSTMGLSSAQATTVFDFQTPAGDPCGAACSTHTYTVGGVSITADGFTGSISGGNFSSTGAVNLWDKTGGGDENGLGLKNDPNGQPSSPQNEITFGSFVRITMPAGLASVLFSMGSTTSTQPESWTVYGCTAATSGCTALITGGTDESSHSLTLDPFYYFTEATANTTNPSNTPNVLLHELDVTTPLPAALPLFATGLGAVGLLGWRRKRKASAAIAV